MSSIHASFTETEVTDINGIHTCQPSKSNNFECPNLKEKLTTSSLQLRLQYPVYNII